MSDKTKQREIKFEKWAEFMKYEIGSDGSVWSLNYNHTGQRRQMRQYLDQDGYPYVCFMIGGKRVKRIIHRMVAKCFVENPDGKPQVNHKNGVRNDNRAENLEWCTSQENTLHGYRVNGRRSSLRQIEASRMSFQGGNNPKAKVNEVIVLSIRRLRAKGDSLNERQD